MRLVLISLAAAALAACATPVEAPQGAAASAQPMPPTAAEPVPQLFNVQLAPGIDPKAGRLIVVAAPAASVRIALDDKLQRPRFLSASGANYVAAQEAPIVAPANPTRLDADMLAYPRPFSRIEPGEYWVQVRLDVDHSFAYSPVFDADYDPDYVSVPVKMTLPLAASVSITLQPEIQVWSPESPPVTGPSLEAPCDGKRMVASANPGEFEAHRKLIDFVSPSLSEFWGRPTHVCGVILLPPDYDTSRETYPTVYRTEGFGASMNSLPGIARRHYNLMKSGETPPMIRVFLDHSSPWGTHEFADSVNNGPWGTALTEELIPWLETQFRMDAKSSGRFTTGHSSGGWFAIWTQVRYPQVFGGTWARAPDPVDFRSFTGIDIYRESANAYTRPDASPQYLVRDAAGKETTSFRDYALRENVLGEYGGQIDSFDWVFSPRGQDGRPQPLFDRMTGKVDPEVARYWRDHFDISHIIRRDWTSLKPVLDGKIHLIMGTLDTFHLDEAALLLDQEMRKLGARADFMWMDGRNHGNLDRIGDDPMGLEKKIAWEMYAIARPGMPLKPKSAAQSSPEQ